MIGKRHIFCCCVVTGVILFSCIAYPNMYEKKPIYKIGVYSTYGKDECLRTWDNTARDLGDKIEWARFEIVPLYPDEINKNVTDRLVDFMLIDPATYIYLEMNFKAERIVTLKNTYQGKGFTSYGGVIFTLARRTDINSVSDIKGKKVRASDIYSFGGWLAALRELREHGVDPQKDAGKLSFQGGRQDSVVYSVRDNNADIGIVRTSVLENLAAEGRIRLEDYKVLNKHDSLKDGFPLLHSTRLYPEWPLAKLEHTSTDLAQEVAVALLSIDPDDIAAVTGRYYGWTIPLNYQEVHKCLKELRVRPYKEYGKVTIKDVIKEYWYWIISLLVLIILMAAALYRVEKLNMKLAKSQKVLNKEISERKKTEHALRDSENEQKIILDSVPALIFYKDAHNKLIRVNAAFANAVGLSKEKIEGKSCFELFPHYAEAYWKDDLDIINSGKAKKRIEEPLKRKDGSILHLVTDKLPYINETGDTIGIIGFSIDVTEKIEMTKALDEIQQQQNAILNNITDMAWLKDRSGNLISVNEAFAKACGRGINNVVGKADMDIWPKDFAVKYKADDEEVIYTKERRVIEEPFSCVYGVRWMETVKTPVLNDKGEVIGIAGVARDITERKNLNDELKRNLEDLRQFQKATIDRENHMIELKKEINKLSMEVGRPAPYDLSFLNSKHE